MDSKPITIVKQIGKSGNSLTINITQECKMLGVQCGELVRVTIERF